ncbi:MAG: cobaltochelatase subunit CobS, partial [Pseudomonadota bacterium]
MQISDLPEKPDQLVSVSELFGFSSQLKVHAYSQTSDLVPEIDPGYHFNPEVTQAILAGFEHNRRVMLQGL